MIFLAESLFEGTLGTRYIENNKRKGGDSMAVKKSFPRKELVVAFCEGYDEKGKEIIKRYSYSNIDGNSTSESLLDAADAIAALSKNEVFEVTTLDTNTLMVL